MKLCLVMMARVQVEGDDYLLDRKNINVIERYLRYFDEIKVVARRAKGSKSLYPREIYNNGKVSFDLYDEMKNPVKLINYMKEFKKVLSEQIASCDLVLCWAEPKSNIIVNMSQKFKTPCIVYVGVCIRDSLLSKRSPLKKIAGRLLYFPIKKSISKANYVHYVTDSELQKRYPTNNKQIGASYVNIDTEVDEEFKNSKINRYQKRISKVTLGLIGYLNEIKGIDTAIKALSKLDENYTLKILGGGDSFYYKTLAKKYNVEDRVIFEGTLPPGPPVANWLNNIDIYIQPSRTEGLPRATMEAMSRGCPTVTSTAMGLMELTDKKWLHDPGDYNKMAYLINELSNSPTELMKQSNRSFNIAKKYNRKTLDERIDSFFMEIINDIKK